MRANEPAAQLTAWSLLRALRSPSREGHQALVDGSDPRHQGLSAREVGARCPVYGAMDGGQEGRARADLNAMQDFDCTVLASRNRPAQWTVTSLGAGAA